jgi:hypothetical protein
VVVELQTVRHETFGGEPVPVAHEFGRGKWKSFTNGISMSFVGKRRRAAAVQDAKRSPMIYEPREASWSAPVLWRFGTGVRGASIPPAGSARGRWPRAVRGNGLLGAGNGMGIFEN